MKALVPTMARRETIWPISRPRRRASSGVRLAYQLIGPAVMAAMTAMKPIRLASSLRSPQRSGWP
ncbi:hypothetical protein D3C72_1047630 [compost metagenome]